MEIKTRIGKGQEGYGYKYTDLAQINLYCEENKITYYQYIEPLIVENQVIDYVMTVITRNDKTEPAKRGVRLVDATLQGIKNPAQEQGSATTYARRYSLLMALGLATEDDDGSSLTQKKSGKDYNKELKKYVADNDLDINEIAREYKLNAKSTNEDFKEALENLKGE